MVALNEENQRVLDSLRSKTLEAEEWQRKYMSSGEKEALASENQKLRFVLEEKLREIDALRDKLALKADSEIREKEKDNKIAMLASEIERLNLVVREAQGDAQNWRRRCDDNMDLAAREKSTLVEENSRLRR